MRTTDSNLSPVTPEPSCSTRHCDRLHGPTSAVELVARDRFGNARPGPSGPWAVSLSHGPKLESHGLEGQRPSSEDLCDDFSSDLVPAQSGNTLARFRACVPGVHSLLVTCGSDAALISQMPKDLMVVPAAFGASLRSAVAGEPSRFWLVLDPELGPPAASAAALAKLRRVKASMHSQHPSKSRFKSASSTLLLSVL